LRRQLLSSSLLVFIYHRPLRLILLYRLFVYKHSWLYSIVIESSCHFSLKTSIFFIRRPMQLLFDFLQFAHQVELGLRAPQVEYTILVGSGDDPAQATFRVDLHLDGCRKALGVWGQHAGRTDTAGDTIRRKLSLPANWDRIQFFFFPLF